MDSRLAEILAHTRLRVAERKAAVDLRALERSAADRKPRGFAAALRKAAGQGMAVIAELKKASPSKGVLREEFQPVELARAFQSAGATALSVLTDERFFQGSLTHLMEVSAVVDLPLLRKDFTVDRFQILEAKAAGADAILLIVAAHHDRDLLDLAEEAAHRGLDVLCETHTLNEIDRAVQLGFEIIGVNSRNLKTLVVDPQVQAALVEHLPSSVLRVAESGVRTRDDIDRLRHAGYDAFLIGEALMREPEPGVHLASMLAQPSPAVVSA